MKRFDQLSGSMDITVSLTAPKRAAAGSRTLLFRLDPETGVLCKTNAVFDRSAGTVAFSTNLPGTYVIAADKTAAGFPRSRLLPRTDKACFRSGTKSDWKQALLFSARQRQADGFDVFSLAAQTK